MTKQEGNRAVASVIFLKFFIAWGIPVVMLPSTVGGTPAATDLFTLFDDIIQRLTSVQG